MKTKGISERLTKFLKAAILALSGYYILSFLVIALLRMAFPWDIEWMEGGMVEHVWRLVNGLSIYTEPSLEFIPFIYTPVYFYVSSWLSEVFGVGFLPLRFLSTFATLITFVFLYLLIREQTKSKKLGIISVGLYAACFQLSGYWYDLARVDSLFIAFFMASFFFYMHRKNVFCLLLAGTLAALSFLTKQTALIFILPLLVYSFFELKWRSIYYVLSFTIIAASVSIYFNVVSDGWFYHWLVEIPAGHQWLYRKFITFWVSDIFQPLFFAFAVSAVFLLYKYRSKEFSKLIQYGLLFAGLLLCSWLSRIHLGGYDNVLMPAFLGIAILFGLGLNELFTKLSKANEQTSGHIKILILIAITSQFFVLFYNPLPQIPKEEDYAYGKKLIAYIGMHEGEVLIPDHPYISRYVGKKSYPHYYVLKDFFESNSPMKDEIKKQYIDAIKNKKFDAVIFDTREGYEEFSKYYEFNRTMFEADEYLKCKTGGHLTRPEFLFRPK